MPASRARCASRPRRARRGRCRRWQHALVVERGGAARLAVLRQLSRDLADRLGVPVAADWAADPKPAAAAARAPVRRWHVRRAVEAQPTPKLGCDGHRRALDARALPVHALLARGHADGAVRRVVVVPVRPPVDDALGGVGGVFGPKGQAARQRVGLGAAPHLYPILAVDPSAERRHRRRARILLVPREELGVLMLLLARGRLLQRVAYFASPLFILCVPGHARVARLWDVGVAPPVGVPAPRPLLGHRRWRWRWRRRPALALAR